MDITNYLKQKGLSVKTFDHDTDTGICTYAELVSINNDTDAFALIMGVLTGFLDGTVIKVGKAKLNPKDKHYIKSIGREVAMSRSGSHFFKATEIKNFGTGSTTLILSNSGLNMYIRLRVAKGKRVHVEIY
jgi:hypothetical protein